jgi:ArsR family transcriptional regulator
MMEYKTRAMQPARVDLFRLLGDADRLRLLALCAEEELTVGELAALIGESQPQVTKKTQPLREAGLLVARRDGTRTLLRAPAGGDVLVGAALDEGRALCARDGSLARVAAVIAQREELARRVFADAAAPAAEPAPAPAGADPALRGWLPLLAPLLPRAVLAVDAGTGDGALLPLLSALYERVVGVDRSPARLARCAARIAAWGLPNVRLREGDVDDATLAQEIDERGGADLVTLARVLRYAARPQDVVAAAARLVRPGGHLALVDFLPHDDEARREHGDVWLGFEPGKLGAFLAGSGLEAVAQHPFPGSVPGGQHPPLQLAIGRRPVRGDAVPLA